MRFLKKYLAMSVFLVVIYAGLITSVLVEDSEFSEIENKILTQKPELTVGDIKEGAYMKSFDKYVVDQFPERIKFVNFKNRVMYGLGYREFRDIYYTKGGRLLEKFIFNKDNINKNLDIMNMLNDYFKIDSVGMFIPNSISIYKEELPFYALSDSQEELLKYIKGNFKGEYYTPYKILLENKSKDIYFKTDHHWTQYGAGLMYEDYYGKRIDSDYMEVSEDFLGTYYSKVLFDSIKPDKIYAYKEFKDYNIQYDGITSNSLYDKSKLKGKNKYQYFLNGDPAMAVIEGAGKGEVLIFKDSFAHAYIPFLTKEYSKIHVVDPRYSNVNIVDYIQQNRNISKIYYIYSLSSLNSSNIFAKYKSMLK